MARARLMLVLAACGAALALCALRGVLAGVARQAGDRGAAEQRPGAQEPSAAAQVAPSAPTEGVPPVADAERRAVEASSAREGSPQVLGTVVDASGAPLANAEVSFFDVELYGSEAPAGRQAPRPARRLRTGADGRFAFPVPEADRRYGVQVHAEGRVPKGRNQSPGIDAPFELCAAGALAGRVLGTDGALAEVLYQGATFKDGVLVEGEFLASDGSGGYAVRDLPVGRACTLQVKPVGGPPVRFEIPIAASGELRHDLDLGPRRWAELRATHAFTGEPIAGATAAVGWLGRNQELARSGADGLLRVALQGDQGPPSSPAERPASWRSVTVHAPGMLACAVGWLPLDGAPPLGVRLVPSARLAGRVVSGAGEPVRGAEVRWVMPRAVVDPDFGSLANGPASFAAVTGADGCFALEDVLWSRPDAVLEVWVAGERRRVVLGAAPTEPGTTREIEVELFGSPTIAGRAWTPASRVERWSALAQRQRAAARGPVIAVRAALDPGGPALEVRAGADGAFRFSDLAPGFYAVSAGDAAGNRSRQTVVAVPGEEAEALALALLPAQRAVTGRILQADGTPWVDGYVQFDPTYLGTPGARTDADGFFSAQLELYPDDEVELAVELQLASSALDPQWKADADVVLRELPLAGGLVWTLPELVPVRVRVVTSDGAEAPRYPLRYAWQRPEEGDGTWIAEVPTHATGPWPEEASAEPPPAGEVQLCLPLGASELWLELAGDPPQVLERHVTLPGDAPDGVLTIAL